jgi:hypothetical protein
MGGVQSFASGRVLPLTTQTPLVYNDTAFCPSAASGVILTANQNRRYLTISNSGANPCYLAFGQSAVVGQGVRLSEANQRGNTYNMNREGLWLGYIAGIASGGTTTLTITEGIEGSVNTVTVVDPTISRSMDSGTNPVYATVRNAANANALSQNPLTAGQIFNGGQYSVYRLGLEFLTGPAIPAYARILSAKLQLYCSVNNIPGNIRIIADTNLPGSAPTIPSNPIVVGDYNIANYNTAPPYYGSIAAFAIGSYNDITLTTNTVYKLIQQGGTAVTKCLAIADNDITSTPPVGTETVEFGDGTNGNQIPKLEITYIA